MIDALVETLLSLGLRREDLHADVFFDVFFTPPDDVDAEGSGATG